VKNGKKNNLNNIYSNTGSKSFESGDNQSKVKLFPESHGTAGQNEIQGKK